jgi:hypothetical protein
MLKFYLKPFLERHHISAYQLVQATKGKLSESTVYGMSRKPLQRVDLGSAGLILEALRELTDEPVQFQDLLEEHDDLKVASQKSRINPKYANLLKNAKPITREHLEKTTHQVSAKELEKDQQFWREYRETQRQLQIEHEAVQDKELK